MQAIYDEFIKHKYSGIYKNIKEAEPVIKNYLQKYGWHKKVDGDKGRLKLGIYGKKVAYLKH